MGNIWRLFAALFAPKFSGNFGTGDAASQDYTIPAISRKFWDGPSQIFPKFWNDFLLSRIKFLGNFVPTKFWAGRRSTLSRLQPKFPGNFGTGKIWQLFAVLCAPKFSGNFGTRNASSRDYTKHQISRKFWNDAFQNFQEILE